MVRRSWEFARARGKSELIRLPEGGEVVVLFFGGAEEAVRCALEVSTAQTPDLPLRIGVHTGPVACTDADSVTEEAGIEVAQRVAGYGEAGHLLVSGTAADQIMEHSEWRESLHHLGKVTLKDEAHVPVFNLYGPQFGNSATPRKLRNPGAIEETATGMAVFPDPMIGRQVAHYQIVKLLGGGGMGVVYEGLDLRLDRHVAIKFLPEGRSVNHSVSGRFQQEARAAAALNHPNICTVHDVGDYAGRPFIVMELLDGHMLKYLLSRKRLTSEEILDVGIQIADALDGAHSNGVIHRDIKPSNIFVTARRQVKVLDFGLAKFTSIRRRRQTTSHVRLGGDVTESHMTRPGEFLGTVAYMSPEQARGQKLDARSDLFSFGVVLYEMATGKLPFRGDTSAVIFEAILSRAPISPEYLNPHLPQELERIINKALQKDRNARYQAASEMRAELEHARASLGALAVTQSPHAAAEQKAGEIALLYKRNAQPDEQVLALIENGLRQDGRRVFIDRHLQVGIEWAREIEKRVSNAEAVVVLLSESSVTSEMLAYEIQIAHESLQSRGKPRILPVRINFEDPLPPALSAYLDGIQYARWNSSADDHDLIQEITESLENPSKTYPRHLKLEPAGGAVPLDSEFYIVRPTDRELFEAIARNDSIILIKGARQMGKTSSMARGLQEARKAGSAVVLTDFQKLNASQLETVEKLFLSLAEAIAEQLNIDLALEKAWNPRRGPSLNFDRFLRREILARLSTPLVWGIDEIDRLFSCSFGSEVFGLFRAWHNERSLDPTGPWERLTLAIAYATEAHLFITDMNQSPFNVGTRLMLADFTPAQVAELNRRYSSPLKTPSELEHFNDLVGGQPYLTRRGLQEMVTHNLSFAEWEKGAARDEGPYGDHLRRLLVSLAQDAELYQVVRAMIAGKESAPPEAFYRLRSSGLVSGESAKEMRFRCRLYALYLGRHLL